VAEGHRRHFGLALVLSPSAFTASRAAWMPWRPCGCGSSAAMHGTSITKLGGPLAVTSCAGWRPVTRDKAGQMMNIRRVLLDVDKAIQRPEIIDIAKAIDAAPGVAGLNITVTEIDVQTVGMDITVEGDNIDVGALFRAIESTGAVVHSIDELAAGEKLVERVARER
jgi:hypothetical protein